MLVICGLGIGQDGPDGQGQGIQEDYTLHGLVLFRQKSPHPHGEICRLQVAQGPLEGKLYQFRLALGGGAVKGLNQGILEGGVPPANPGRYW